MLIRRLSTAVLVIFVGTVVFFAAFMAAGALPVQDFAQYWSAAHLIRDNPYSPALVSAFQNSHGIHVHPPLVLKNPPWTIPTFLPLGLLSYRVGFAFWTLMTLVVFLGCTHAMWRELAPAEAATPLHMALLFGPAIVQLMLGQWTVLVLLGVVIFLMSVENRNDGLAGASLVLVLGKPHVALLFLVAVLLWSALHKRWRLFAGATVALAAAILIVTFLNPHVWNQFVVRTRQVVHETEAYPNLGGMLYISSGHHFLAIIPQLAGAVWLIFYFKRHWRSWKWWEQGTTVILFSVVCSYYSYPYDQILCLPALIAAYARGNRRGFLLGFAITNLGFLAYLSNVAGHFGYGYMFLWWTELGWLLAVLLAKTSILAKAATIPQQTRYSDSRVRY